MAAIRAGADIGGDELGDVVRIDFALRDRIFCGNREGKPISFNGRTVKLLTRVEFAQPEIGERGRRGLAEQLGIEIARVAQIVFGGNDTALPVVDFPHQRNGIGAPPQGQTRFLADDPERLFAPRRAH